MFFLISALLLQNSCVQNGDVGIEVPEHKRLVAFTEQLDIAGIKYEADQNNVVWVAIADERNASRILYSLPGDLSGEVSHSWDSELANFCLMKLLRENELPYRATGSIEGIEIYWTPANEAQMLSIENRVSDFSSLNSTGVANLRQNCN